MAESVFTLPYQTNGNHATEPSTFSHVISERHWKSTSDFPEIVNNYELKRGTVCQIVRFISQFSLKLYIQFWNYFDSIVLGSVGKGYLKKQGVRIFGQIFWLGCLSAFKVYRYCMNWISVHPEKIRQQFKFFSWIRSFPIKMERYIESELCSIFWGKPVAKNLVLCSLGCSFIYIKVICMFGWVSHFQYYF